SLTEALASPSSLTKYVSTTQTVSEEMIKRQAMADLKARLSSNENPFGPSEKAKKAIVDAIDKSYQYPMKTLQELTKTIATYEGLTPEHVMLGAGSGPLLQAAVVHFGKMGGNLVSGDPTYGNIPNDMTEHFKTIWKKVPLTSDYKLDLDAMEKAVDDKTVLMYVCNPNNPTGTTVDAAKLKAFCERVSKKVPVFVDEAYIDYMDNPKEASVMECIKKGHNVMVARTFSKLYGFAGLRVGYMVAQPAMLETMKPLTKGARSISATSGSAALASYQDAEFLQMALKKTVESKEYLYSILKKRGYDYIPSSTNFVLFPIKMDGKKFTEEMMNRGVSVRFWKFNDKDWCRVSIGLMDEMKVFEEAFTQIA
ncbi:MAG TPA: histidinol-phosphate transaminase, partial [Chryseolinea sp.]|nr:histidinol-phosphate transaminase [Chryseolinea sp.]